MVLRCSRTWGKARIRLSTILKFLSAENFTKIHSQVLYDSKHERIQDFFFKRAFINSIILYNNSNFEGVVFL